MGLVPNPVTYYQNLSHLLSNPVTPCTRLCHTLYQLFFTPYNRLCHTLYPTLPYLTKPCHILYQTLSHYVPDPANTLYSERGAGRSPAPREFSLNAVYTLSNTFLRSLVGY